MTVLQFPNGGSSSAGDDDLLVCECGSAWFELYVLDEDGEKVNGAVVLNHRGNITGYNGIPHCVECGREKLP